MHPVNHHQQMILIQDEVKVNESKLRSANANNVDSIAITNLNADGLNQVETVSKSSDSLEIAPKINEIITSSSIQSLETENDVGNATENAFLETKKIQKLSNFYNHHQLKHKSKIMKTKNVMN